MFKDLFKRASLNTYKHSYSSLRNKYLLYPLMNFSAKRAIELEKNDNVDSSLKHGKFVRT